MKSVFALLLLSIAFGLVSSCKPTSVVADLGAGRTVTMQVNALFGFHSDWDRALVISDGTNEVSVELFQDTGWWRGSALYREAGGVYFLNDGIDYLRFVLCPPAMIAWKDASTAGSCAPSSLELSSPPSKHYPERGELSYLGYFVENPDGPGVVFKT